MSTRTNEFAKPGAIAATDYLLALVSGAEAQVLPSELAAIIAPAASAVTASPGSVLSGATVQAQLDTADSELADHETRVTALEGAAVDAVDVAVADAGGYYTGTDAEAALQELGAATAADEAALTAHEADTLAVHGIADTSLLLDTADIGVSVQAHSAVLDATTASFTTADETKLDGIEALADVTDAVNVAAAGAVMQTAVPLELGFACSDESTAIDATGVKFQMTMPTARTITSYFACLNSACATGTFTIDILKNDVSVLSTLITIDATETSTLTALTAAVVATTAWAAGDVLKVSVTDAGDLTATGLKVVPAGTRDAS